MSDYGERLKALRKARYPDFSEDMDMHDITDGISWMADRIEELEERLENEMQDLDAADRRAKRLQNRIEELEAENGLLRDAVYIDDLTVTMQADDRSKAMVAMKRALDFLNADMPTEAKTALRTTLAELTGGKDE